MAALVLGVRADAQPARPCSDAATELAANSGTWSGALAATVTLHARGLSLRDALDRLGAQSGVPLAYSSDLLPLDRPVCVVADRQPLGRVLATLLEGTNVEALLVAGKVVLAPSTSAAPREAPKVSVLERVIVTGSAIAASRRPLAVGVEVIDGDEIRRSSYADLASALDTYVPGMWIWAQSAGSLVAQYGGVRGASSFSTSYPKMYIDGIEVANPLLVTQLNPDAVDRVEVIRGPQGSALYGSDAISGVINVITRHDGTGPSGARVRVSSLAGASASEFGPSPVPTHDQRLSVRNGTNLGSAGVSIEFGQTGAVFPSAQSRQLSILGDGRRVTSSAVLSGTARLFDRRAGVGNNPLLEGVGTPWVDTSASSGPGGGTGRGGYDDQRPVMSTLRDGDQHVRLYTVGGSAMFATHGVWTHTLTAGVDGFQLDNVADATNPFDDGVDATRRGATGNGDRTTLRASSVAQLGGASALPATTITLSVEHSVLRQRSTVTDVIAPAGGERYGTAVEGTALLWNHNTGALVQASTAWRDALFLTGGVRVERNDAFSGNDRYPILPLLGGALVHAFGPVEMKLRSSYGKGIRPFQTPARFSFNEYGPTGIGRAGLDPEVQTGIENGVELYVGDLFSFQATRFDQRATGLIQNVAVAVDTQLRGGSLERRMRFQLENVGEITNRGWEMQAGLRRGALGVSGTFSTVDSRVRTVADGYLGDLRAGDRMLAVPARTSSLSASWTQPRWTLALTATRAADWVNYDRVALARDYTGADGAQRDVTGARLRSYWRDYSGQTHLRLSASRDVGHGLTLLGLGDNLLGGQVGEPDNLTIRQGRTLSGGLRASF
ncbi:MAG: TonB-dependent receptor plug domain-containing protein [Gemmatimonadetes bacterium]|nr:TonB-dependent receptor plug domain-containing protein [Gemmatimonadota bacterium]